MRLIIAGSRSIAEFRNVQKAMEFYDLNPLTIISGTANGVDKLGEIWARRNNVPVERYPANWDKYGKSAGYIRNQEMAKAADSLLAIWDGESRGTKHMIDIANKQGLDVYIFVVSKETGLPDNV